MIRVLKIKKVSNCGNKLAYVSVNIDGITMHEFSIVQQPGQAPWVCVPQRSYKDAQGEPRYFNLVELPDELKKQIKDCVLRAYNATK